MTKIRDSFNNKKVLIPYFTYGDPTPEISERIICNAFDQGADMIEIGLPFSDPIADGPVIQESHQRALNHNRNINIDEALTMVKRIKTKYNKPLIFMTSINLIYKYGIKKFFNNADKHNLDGIIIPDLPPEEASECIKHSKRNKIDLIFLISPLCNEARIKSIVNAGSGFIYLISSTGTTGERQSISSDLTKTVSIIKKFKDIPVAIGFGISKKEHLDTVYEIADGAIIGSFFVKMIKNNPGNPDKTIEIIGNKIRDFSF